MTSVGVLGAGAWGTALAQMLGSDGTEVLLWALEPELVEEINASHANSLYLPSARLSPSIRATGDVAEAAQCDILLLVTPAQHMGRVLAAFPSFPRDLVLCNKGIEAGSGRLMAEVAA
ncbi:MAG: glycerol-3-phosphate dehydrogenase [Proteobacteria bacterium]|nr:glycerol-3-phosphate dehydrogenase [Pseudomonadota bacterium]